jgi:UDP-N-acetylmuramate--alanine ligase
MDIDLTTIKKVYFVGIGGIGISAIARMLKEEGKEVAGSDMTENTVTQELRALGIAVDIGQSFALIPADADLIVYTIAIKHYDPALMENIYESGIPAKSYPEMLHLVTAGKRTIAVSGTHGKTTTTAMIAKILIETKRDPSVIVGSFLKDYKSNLIVGASDLFVVEACEYERSFLNIEPKILVITNIEADHLDYYKDLADIENAFTEMATQTGSAIVCDPHDPSVVRVLGQLSEDKKLEIVDYTEWYSRVPALAVAGEHNRKNAAAALAVAHVLGVPAEEAEAAVAQFQGTWRRMEYKGTTASGTIVYDDYAHHPTEVRASIQALREMYPEGTKKLTIVFQPHLYSRTKALFVEFATAFTGADAVHFLPIFFAREAPDPTVSSELLAEAVLSYVPEVRAFPDFFAAQEALKEKGLGSNDVVVTMGAGEAYKIGNFLLN